MYTKSQKLLCDNSLFFSVKNGNSKTHYSVNGFIKSSVCHWLDIQYHSIKQVKLKTNMINKNCAIHTFVTVLQSWHLFVPFYRHYSQIKYTYGKVMIYTVTQSAWTLIFLFLLYTDAANKTPQRLNCIILSLVRVGTYWTFLTPTNVILFYKYVLNKNLNAIVNKSVVMLKWHQ